MKRVQGNPDVALLECTNPVRNKWRVRWDVSIDESGTTSYMEEEFNHKPSDAEIKSTICGWIDEQTRNAILSGFSYEAIPFGSLSRIRPTTKGTTTRSDSVYPDHCLSLSNSALMKSRSIVYSRPSMTSKSFTKATHPTSRRCSLPDGTPRTRLTWNSTAWTDPPAFRGGHKKCPRPVNRRLTF